MKRNSNQYHINRKIKKNDYINTIDEFRSLNLEKDTLSFNLEERSIGKIKLTNNFKKYFKLIENQ